jgi:hypothetical protein
MLKGKRLMHGRSGFEIKLLLAVPEFAIPEFAVKKAAYNTVAHALAVALVS